MHGSSTARSTGAAVGAATAGAGRHVARAGARVAAAVLAAGTRRVARLIPSAAASGTPAIGVAGAWHGAATQVVTNGDV